MIDLV